MLTVGIIGCGFVGFALRDWLEKNNKGANVVVSAPPKGLNDGISGAGWARVHAGTPLTGHISDTRTFVPGSDGKSGYGYGEYM